VNRLAPAVLLSSLLLATRSGAPPPLSRFPDVVTPVSGTAPSNTFVWAFGDPAPAPADVFISARIGNTDVTPVVERATAEFIQWRIPGMLEGDAVTFRIAYVDAEANGSFTVGPADTTQPTLSRADLLVTDLMGLTIGVVATDDTAVAGAFGRSVNDNALIAATAVDRLLIVDDGCANVTAVDLAGNESAVNVVCAPDDFGEGEGEGDVGEGEGEGEGDEGEDGGCAGSPAGVACVLALLLRRRR
jgi:hypothetical protein